MREAKVLIVKEVLELYIKNKKLVEFGANEAQAFADLKVTEIYGPVNISRDKARILTFLSTPKGLNIIEGKI